jgi:hypothetical protein
VGKHALKFAYEFDLSDDDNAPVKTFCSAIALGPGALAIGARGGGEGDAEFRWGMTGML